MAGITITEKEKGTLFGPARGPSRSRSHRPTLLVTNGMRGGEGDVATGHPDTPITEACWRLHGLEGREREGEREGRPTPELLADLTQLGVRHVRMGRGQPPA
jgi:hypothetical protein